MNAVQIVDESGTTWNLSGGNPCNFVYLNGAKVSPIRRLMQKSPLQNGVLDKGFRLDPRQMELQLAINAPDERQAEARWDRLAHLFTPTTSPLQLRVTRNDGDVRAIDCFVNGPVDYQMFTDTAVKSLISVPLLAPNPLWYFPTQQVLTQSLSGGSTSFVIPVTGLTGDDWPIMEITGPAQVAIQHHTGSIVFGPMIPSGETFRIDLRPGYKTVTRVSDGANRLSYINSDRLPQFSTMCLLSEKAMRTWYGQTSNTFTILADAVATSASSATFKYYKRYLSL